MGKTIKAGGIGKNPAIEKINRLRAMESDLDAAAQLEKEIFGSEDHEWTGRMNEIIRDFSIDFNQS